jgi:lipopolysaccharide export system permease protein
MKSLRILDRYFLYEFLKAFVLSLAALLLIILVVKAQAVFKIESRQDPVHRYLLLLYSLPSQISFLLPMAILFAVCFTVAQFTVSREIVACMSAGLPFFRTIRPIWIAAAVMVPILFVFQNFLVTPANRLAAEEEGLLKKETATLKDLVWQKNLKGKEGFYFLYYLERKEKKVKGGFNYIQLKDDKPVRMLQANSALYDPATDLWTLRKTREILFKEDLSVSKVNNYEELVEKLPDPYEFFENPLLDPEELNLFEVAAEIRKKEELGFQVAAYNFRFHSILAFPFLCFVVAVIASIAGSGGSHRGQGPLVRALLVSAGAFLVYFLTAGLARSFGTEGIVWPWTAAWFPTVLFLAGAVVLVWRNRQ